MWTWNLEKLVFCLDLDCTFDTVHLEKLGFCLDLDRTFDTVILEKRNQAHDFYQKNNYNSTREYKKQKKKKKQ